MKTLSYELSSTKKYIVYSHDETLKIVLHYVYTIFTSRQLTQVTRYENGRIVDKITIPLIIPFSKKDPIKSINKFNQVLVLQN